MTPDLLAAMRADIAAAKTTSHALPIGPNPAQEDQ